MDTIENIKTGMRSVKRNERTREKHRGVGGDMSERKRGVRKKKKGEKKEGKNMQGNMREKKRKMVRANNI